MSVQKLIATERLRREIKQKQEKDLFELARRTAFEQGRKWGKEEISASRVQLPSNYIESILQSMSDIFARKAVEAVGEKFPYPVIGRVAQKAWDEIRNNGFSLDAAAEMAVWEEAKTENKSFVVHVTIPAMELKEKVDLKILQLVRGRR